MKTRWILSLVPLLAVACHSSDDGASPPEENVAVALESLTSCQEFADLLRKAAHAQVDEAVDEALEALATSDESMCYEYEDGAMPLAGNAEEGSSSSPSSVSETNNQVVGVDEADLVKTDGQYIYLAQGQELRIVDAWPANESRIAARLPFEGTAKKLLVSGDRALVYLSHPRSQPESVYFSRGAGDCTYGYGCDFSGDGTATSLVVVDISDRTAPHVLRTLDFAGSLIAARQIGTAVHTVVSLAEVGIPLSSLPSAWDYGCNSLTSAEKATERAKLAQRRAELHREVDEAKVEVPLLASEDGFITGSQNCSDYYRESLPDGNGITTVASLDLADDDSLVQLSHVVSRAGAVYASKSSLYMAVPHQRASLGSWYMGSEGAEASTVHEFRIGKDPSTTAYVASGMVPGRVLNQFSMDEYDGVLRVATTTGMVPDPDVESTLSILRRTDHQLAVIGSIDHIAPTEDIRSVRFDGDRGYLVTFKKTDPLFVLDLADPSKPRLVGELKIPGFSTYMHRLDADHLLALGYEADDHGEFAYFNGIQLQIFDVTKPTAPTLLHKKVFGTRGSSSSALTNHLGFTFLAERGLLTLPMSICEGGGDGAYGTLSFSGVVALEVSVENGISEIGRLDEPYPTDETEDQTEFEMGAACSDWWTDSNSVVERTVVMDQFLYAISDNRVRIQDLGALGTDVSVVDF